jgi:hypothetical protein
VLDGLGLLLRHVELVKLLHHRGLVKLQLGGLHLVKGVVARDCRFLWALVGNLQPRGVALPLRADQGSLTAFLMFPVTMFPRVLIVGAYLAFTSTSSNLPFLEKHVGELVLGPSFLLLISLH